MNIKVFQKGFNYSQDGPGNRLVYHLRGCNMRCPWCANPEGLSALGSAIDADALIDEALRSRIMFFDGGGVTFTGGEPTMQFEALQYILTTLRGHGIDTCIETNASHPQLPELFGLIDHLIMDYKQPFAGLHQSITGVKLETVEENLRRACAEHPDVLIHIPLVNGYNASSEEMEGMAAFLASIPKRNVRVEPLWYHEYGKTKWEQLGMPYAVKSGHLTDEQKRSFLEILRAHGLSIVRT